MFRKFSNRQLGIVLGSLLGLYLISWVIDRPTDNTFEKELVSLDTAQINRIVITPPDEEAPLELQKNEGSWMIQQADQSYRASENLIKAALSAVNSLTANQLVSNREASWEEYEVSDSAGVKVEVYEAGDLAANLVLGRSQFQQTGMMTYVRQADQPQVYLVDGYINSTFDKPIDDWRDKTLIEGPDSQWSSMSFNYPADSSFRIFRGPNNRWMLPDSVLLDAAEMSRYLNRITSLKGATFVEQPQGQPLMRLEISRATEPITVSAFAPNDSTYILNSSLNPEAYFEGNNIWKNVFVGLNQLLAE